MIEDIVSTQGTTPKKSVRLETRGSMYLRLSPEAGLNLTLLPRIVQFCNCSLGSATFQISLENVAFVKTFLCFMHKLNFVEVLKAMLHGKHLSFTACGF